MIDRSNPFIQQLHKLCKKDDIVMNQLISGTISWADVPSDDDILELEGWRAYEEVHHRAKSAYHHTVRSQKRAALRNTVKQLKPAGRKPYLIMKQQHTKMILSNGRVTPIKEIVDVVVQEPIEYEEADVEFIAPKPVEVQMEKPVEVQMEKPVEVQVEKSVVTPVVPLIEVPRVSSQLIKRPSKEKFNKKKYVPTPVMYQPSFVQLYVMPILPYICALFLVFIVMHMRL
jgi:hypothetical protein